MIPTMINMNSTNLRKAKIKVMVPIKQNSLIKAKLINKIPTFQEDKNFPK